MKLCYTIRMANKLPVLTLMLLLLTACIPQNPTQTPRPATTLVPPGGSVRIEATGAGPTEETPLGLLKISITNQAGKAIAASLTVSQGRQAGEQVIQELHDVSIAEIVVPANAAGTIWITVKAAGYETFEAGVKPNRFHSFTLDMPIELRPADVQG